MGLSLGGLKPTARNTAPLDEEVTMLMAEFDVDKDGSVSREEFRESLQRWEPSAVPKEGLGNPTDG